jgi:hypothetical protein
VRYELGVERRDRYGRTLAYLYRGGMHNLALVKRGYAVALTIPPNDKYAPRFIGAEQSARARGEGRWSGGCERKRARARNRADRARERAERRRAMRLARRIGAAERRRRAAERQSIRIPEDCSEVDGPIPTPAGDPTNLDGDNDGEACE